MELKLPRKRSCLDEIKPYTPGKPVDEVKRELGLDEVIKLASNENPLGTSPWVIEAMRDALSEVNYYPDTNCFYLRKSLAEKLAVSREQLIFGNGSDEILKLLAETYLNPGDEVIIPRPSFSEYEFVARIMGAKIVFAPLKEDFGYDMEAIANRITPDTKMIFICSPNNPTGTIVHDYDLRTFMEQLPEGIIVVMDEAYYEYADDPAYPECLHYVNNNYPVIVLRTFSKIYGLAGLRIGYGVAPVPLIEDIYRVREPFNVNHLAQVAALAALDDRDFFEKSRQLVLDSRRQVRAGLNELGIEPIPTQANFFFMNTGFNSVEVFQKLLRRGIIVRTGDIFGFPYYIRVNFGIEEDNDSFLAAMKEVLAELRK